MIDDIRPTPDDFAPEFVETPDGRSRWEAEPISPSGKQIFCCLVFWRNGDATRDLAEANALRHSAWRCLELVRLDRIEELFSTLSRS